MMYVLAFSLGVAFGCVCMALLVPYILRKVRTHEVATTVDAQEEMLARMKRERDATMWDD